MRQLIVLIMLFVALTGLSGCVLGDADLTLPDGTKVSVFYVRVGDQSVILKDGEIVQKSEGKAPSGFLAMLAELFM